MESKSEYQVAPRLHIICLTLYKTCCYFKRLLIRLVWMVWLLHFTKLKRVFGLLFPYQWEFIELKILSMPKKKLKNICSRLSSYGVMLMKTYCLKNWASSRCCWNSRFRHWTKWFKLTKKLRDQSLRLWEAKLPWSGRFFQGSRSMKRIHHLHLFQCTTLILARKIHNFYQTGLPLLFYIMLHIRCMWKKFTVHLSLKKLLLRGIM